MAEPANDRVAEEGEGWEPVAPDEIAPIEAPDWASADDDWDFAIEGPTLGERLPAIALGALALGWLGWVCLATISDLAAGTTGAVEIASWIGIASAPLALIGVGWLLLRRTSRREALRFGKTAEAMRNEAKRLDFALRRISDGLAESRATLADECDRIFALGDEAAGRLVSIGDDVRSAAATIGEKSETLDRAARAARGDMDVLLTELPKAEQAARE
ncbi:MAG: hypothetical protein H7X93_06545, partial [Sphingomonadaceae bacterium]|nr:hypothetical protein [Sphingomonadaceae bacterium]